MDKGECRDRSGICGDTAGHCGAESLWMPGCGGGLELDKPTDAQESTPSPSSSPTTAWDAWTGKGKKNDEAKDQTGDAGNAKAPAPGAGAESEELAGFDADAWGYRGEEEEGYLDKGLGMIGFGDDDENGSAARG